MPDAPCDCTYDQWLDSWFLADIADDEIFPGGAVQLYWCDLPASTEISYLTRLLLAPREALARYSNAQLNAGFWELVGASGILSHVCGKSNFPDSSLACLTGIVTLFREAFAERCAQGLDISMNRAAIRSIRSAICGGTSSRSLSVPENGRNVTHCSWKSSAPCSPLTMTPCVKARCMVSATSPGAGNSPWR